MKKKNKYGIFILVMLSIQLNFFPDKRDPNEIGNKRYVYLYNAHSTTYPYLRVIIPIITAIMLVKSMRRKDEES